MNEPDETDESIPFVAISSGEKPGWQALSLDCPACGAACELRRSWNETLQKPGSLQFIKCEGCGKGPWLRGPILADDA